MKVVRPKEVKRHPEMAQYSERTEARIHYFYSAVGNMSFERKDSSCPLVDLWLHYLKEMKMINLSFKLNNNLTHRFLET